MKRVLLLFFFSVLFFACSSLLYAQGQHITGGCHPWASFSSVTPWQTAHDTTILVRGWTYDFEIEGYSDCSGDYRTFFLAPDVSPIDITVNVLGTTGSVIAEGTHHITVSNLSLSPGTYSLKLCMYSLGIEIFDALKVRVVSNVGIAAINKESSVNIYPNPASDILNIATGENISAVTICNVLGQVVGRYEGNGEKAAINISALPAGSYYVTLKGNDEVITRHFVKS